MGLGLNGIGKNRLKSDFHCYNCYHFLGINCDNCYTVLKKKPHFKGFFDGVTIVTMKIAYLYIYIYCDNM